MEGRDGGRRGTLYECAWGVWKLPDRWARGRLNRVDRTPTPRPGGYANGTAFYAIIHPYNYSYDTNPIPRISSFQPCTTLHPRKTHLDILSTQYISPDYQLVPWGNL